MHPKQIQNCLNVLEHVKGVMAAETAADRQQRVVTMRAHTEGLLSNRTFPSFSL
jgi:hypothetical protein